MVCKAKRIKPLTVTDHGQVTTTAHHWRHIMKRIRPELAHVAINIMKSQDWDALHLMVKSGNTKNLKYLADILQAQMDLIVKYAGRENRLNKIRG